MEALDVIDSAQYIIVCRERGGFVCVDSQTSRASQPASEAIYVNLQICVFFICTFHTQLTYFVAVYL